MFSYCRDPRAQVTHRFDGQYLLGQRFFDNDVLGESKPSNSCRSPTALGGDQDVLARIFRPPNAARLQLSVFAEPSNRRRS